MAGLYSAFSMFGIVDYTGLFLCRWLVIFFPNAGLGYTDKEGRFQTIWKKVRGTMIYVNQ